MIVPHNMLVPIDWSAVAGVLCRGQVPPRPEVFDRSVLEALARTDPEAACSALRWATGWSKAPHGVDDLRACLIEWTSSHATVEQPGGEHFVKFAHAVSGRGRSRVEVACCCDCGFAVHRRGADDDAAWTPIWPVTPASTAPTPPTTSLSPGESSRSARRSV
jgi:hypothetical protein